MKHVMSHDLPPELARKVAERAFETYRDKYPSYQPELRWIDDTRAEASFTAKGIHFNGSIELLPGRIAFDLDVPFVLRVFKSKAIAVMERELSHWREQAKSGALS